MDPEKNRHTRLQKLSDSDFEMVDGEPDIVGWDVKDSANKQLGEVNELIFDYESRKVRYLVVDLSGNEYGLEEKDVLVPIGIAELHESDDEVLLPGITAEQLNLLPKFEEERFDTEHESNVRNVFGGLGAAALANGDEDESKEKDFYDHEHFNEGNFYKNRNGKNAEFETTIPIIQEELSVGKREVETGGVRLRSKIVEREVSEDINLKEETVKIVRTPVDKPASSSDLNEQVIEMTEYAEVPTVTKEARIVEEISLNKEVTERDETIKETLKNTEVDVENDTNRNLNSQI